MQFFKNLTAFFLLTLTAVSAVFSMYCVIPKTRALQNDESNNIFIENTTVPQEVFNSSTTNTNVTSKKPESTIPASTKEKVLGKIQETVLSPYNAPLNYNKVYLKNSTGIDIDISSELNKKINVDIKKTIEPEVLIFSTHTTESYHPKFSGCYDRSAETVKSYLKKYPSIKIVIDLHRDSVNYDDGTKVKPTIEIDGKKAAQVMLVAGCEAGAVEGFPNWRENLRLSMKLHQTIEYMYPGLARAITFTARKYNLHLTTGSLLIEIGTEANTLKEAEYSAKLVSNALINLLNTL